MRRSDRATVGVVIGDPCGIGPEVVVKAWASRRLHALCRPVLIGSAAAVRNVIEQRGLEMKLRVIDAPERMTGRTGTIDIIDSGALDPADITPGADNLACGRATGVWLDEADSLARAGRLQATVMGPISSGAMQMAGVLDRVVQVRPGHSYLLLASGALRVAHLTDHVALREVSGLITADLIESALQTLDGVLRQWGMASPRIAVAGFNPHAKGAEEELHITPGIERARATGVDVTGPISPDTVFRHCIEGRFDIVLAMYHDQGHIAIKTTAFAGNVAVILGPPYPHVTVAHGTAYDIVGRGTADHSMILNAIVTAGSLAAGRAFPTLH
ncbi:4-hydroxythreonine-4-phosphate dehydrogenase PdxA [Variovorax paradoxus]|uniref:PdxA family dehydrogenase n=1 Tax=Variovorax paradoxus TaxID=34073 RepID=UPI001ABD29F5